VRSAKSVDELRCEEATLNRLAAPLCWLLLAGCHQGPRLYPVSGKVMYGDKPLPAGVIYFDPDSSKKNDGPQGYAIIQNGEYNTAATGGKGVIGGPHIVRIEGFDGKPGEELPLGRPLFTDFQQPLDLPKAPATQNFDVPAIRR
jgi:hypothetical protein